MSVRVYQTADGNYVVSDNQMWVPGVYASAEAAKIAVLLDPDRLDELLTQVLAARGNMATLTVDDLDGAQEGEG